MPGRRFRIFSSLCLALLLLAPVEASADPDGPEPAPVQPSKAVVARSGAAVAAEAAVPVRHEGGRAYVDLLLPEDAEDVAVRAEGAETAALSFRTVMLPSAPGGASRLKMERSRLEGRVKALKEQAKALLKEPGQTERVEELYAAAAEAEERMDAIGRTLAAMPAARTAGKLATAELSGADGAAEIKVFCSFALPSCGWEPSYAIGCVPGADGMGTVGVRLDAEVFQHSGWDWKDAEIVLVSSGGNDAALPALRKWLVGEEVEALNFKSASSGNGASFSRGRRSAAKQDFAEAPQALASSGAGFASWRPFARGLRSGTTRIFIASDEWKEPLVWLARPTAGDARVFLTVRHEFDGGTYWPAGPARFSIDGAPAGRARFAPAKGTAEISFGADPRVSLTAAAEPRKTGAEGFIGSKKTWEWAWTYVVRNGRDEPVRLRIERPLPESAASDVSVEHSEEPAARTDAAAKAVVWELECAPQKSVSVKHAVKASAPEKKRINPFAP